MKNKTDYFQERCCRYAYLLGIASSIIKSSTSNDVTKKWWDNAIEEVIYKDNRPPRFPIKD